MKYEEVVEIPNGVAEHVKKQVKRTGVRGLDLEKASELGVFNRISFMLCTMHACITTAYMIYGSVDVLLNEIGAMRHDIKKTCSDFEKAIDKFLNFWRLEKYQSEEGTKEMAQEVELLYHQIMKWAQLPEEWEIGDEQHTHNDTDTILKVETSDKELKFHRTTVERTSLEDVKEDYCVTVYNNKTHQQNAVEIGMDKASAQMVAKRMSVEDKENIYTATLLQTITERRTDACPLKTYQDGKLVGRIGKVLKK